MNLDLIIEKTEKMISETPPTSEHLYWLKVNLEVLKLVRQYRDGQRKADEAWEQMTGGRTR